MLLLFHYNYNQIYKIINLVFEIMLKDINKQIEEIYGKQYNTIVRL